jgi:RNA polymerase sigma factor (sigma-70 family)
VRNPVYGRLNLTSFLIAEGSRREEYEPKPGQHECTDEEIAAIRVVLQKLTSLRILNPNDAEDLVQETLLTVIRKNPGIHLEKGLLVWSMGILRRKVGNYYRKVQRYTPLNENQPLYPPGVQQSAMSPEMKVSHKELQTIVETKLAQLPLLQRRAMELLIAGMDTREIVEQLHPERYQNVINRLYRGRKRLARELSKYGYGPFPKIHRRGS